MSAVKKEKETAVKKEKETAVKKEKETAVKVPMGKPRLMLEYSSKIRENLKKELNKSNINTVPKLQKIVVSMGVGSATQDSQHIVDAANDLAMITGQKAVVIKAKKSISNFKLRENVSIGCKVTLRGPRMYDFLETLICIVFPRVRDFRGISPRKFDGRGNYSVGFDDQLVFPMINPDRVKRTQGMNVAFVTSAESNEDGLALLRAFGMPFIK